MNNSTIKILVPDDARLMLKLLAQGSFIAPPMPDTALPLWMESWNGRLKHTQEELP